MTPRALAATLLLAAALAPPALAQSGFTLAQVENKYPRMSPVHIQKCDRDGDGSYTRSEMLCVSSIYQAMYIED